MACIFADGFDWYTSADGLKHWTRFNNTTIVSSTSRLPSGQAALIPNSGSPLGQSFGSNYVQGVIGFAVLRPTSFPTTTLLQILDGSTEQISIRINASAVLTVTRNGTLLATGSTVLSANTWYYIELKFTINNTTGVIELHLNGATEITSTGSLNTRNTANTQWNGFDFNQNASTCLVDDVYALDPTTGANTNFLGPVSVRALYPSGNGNHSDWTPNGGSNFGSIGEQFEDGDTTFIQSATPNDIDTYTMQDVPSASGSIFALGVHLIARQDGGAARTLAPVFRIGSTDYVGSTKSLSTSYQNIGQIYDVSPDTSSAWTVSEVNGLEAGVKLIS